MHWRRKWQPTPVFLPGESQGRGSLMGCRLWGRTESGTTEATQQQQQQVEYQLFIYQFEHISSADDMSFPLFMESDSKHLLFFKKIAFVSSN